MILKASEWQKLLKSTEEIRKAFGMSENDMKVEFLEDGLFMRGEANDCYITLTIKRKEQNNDR